jgi:hypothetical protein
MAVEVLGQDDDGDYWVYHVGEDVGFNLTQPELNALHAALSEHVTVEGEYHGEDDASFDTHMLVSQPACGADVRLTVGRMVDGEEHMLADFLLTADDACSLGQDLHEYSADLVGAPAHCEELPDTPRMSEEGAKRFYAGMSHIVDGPARSEDVPPAGLQVIELPEKWSVSRKRGWIRSYMKLLCCTNAVPDAQPEESQ